MTAPKRKTWNEYEGNVFPPITDQQIDEMIEGYVDEWIEANHIHEVPTITEGLGFDE